jgi:AcrR family transcriptional regulator
MLVYHFGTRDRLLLEALRLARGRQRALYERALDPVGGMPYPRVLRRAWATITRPEAFPYLSLFNELHDLPRTASPWPEFRDLSILDWLPAMERGLRADRYRNAPALATMLVATARGLLSDLVTTGDRRRTTAGWHAAVRLLASAPRSHP